MKFEHLVEVNDLADPAATALSREELWFGLLCRAEDARPFLPGLEACEIMERGEGMLLRELRFGSAVIRDRVTFSELEWIRFESEATPEHAGGWLTISIEEPQPGALFLRFEYRTGLQEDGGSEDGRYADFVRSAYHQSDLDTLKVIRMIAESGRLQ
ncbi:DUF1857 family protein [Azoarcus indigens]|uniref:Uncharacterized protein DUF1857 n=1 Tax=Azoarcus indigens TaxID=29545 RepID=A0A4R6DS75_9RHOO|nr:SRPBCC family protein [Azoarcus indigens]NMG65268.1 DUF1857 family protein [Azoarcus indigens]TDN47916.1 uncharacterized protein DUF1857 [Azoarcus indigens]